MWIPEFLYSLYERMLEAEIDSAAVPAHVGIILDGNRRWAKALGTSAANGHRKGADHVSEVLGWCEAAGIKIVTLWMLSTDNLSRAAAELNDLIGIIGDAVDTLADSGRWNVRVLGDLSLLPEQAAQRLEAAAARSVKAPEAMMVNVAIGYGGRQEVTQAVREYLLERAAAGETLEDVANSLSINEISDHMYTAGQPDPDLIIRTSGEQRMSGFMLWQTVHTELYFCETYWPDFRRVDFLRAIRDFSTRDRRMGK
ncbi:short-chain Z-isoprenyl diphosphate synthase [Arcanobacterium wilhelmae]|uniref:Isoprenyl transferase n=1 Tax=Arcanobacterium wilhelmae TaxID=1803177 RepID=A0ABT9ND03_9ACTO|nr:isoprenyl transferase [Arcanobacterium wilhelmae]MDP9801256.1 short-chain Z-isoprenyl diphosphate synthase [Arcanobacterium wilhelmae]WFN90602.1 isoprenyl transferase [Arcanobacterium wilhelmae]